MSGLGSLFRAGEGGAGRGGGGGGGGGGGRGEGRSGFSGIPNWVCKNLNQATR